MFYPNPVTDEVNLSVTVDKPQQINARIIDNVGRVVVQQQWAILAGSSHHLIDVRKLSGGAYYLELKGDMINERKQFIKR
jgi:hypothetical protein